MSRDFVLVERRRPAAPNAAKQAKARRSAWALGIFVILFYFGMIALNLLRGLASAGAS